MSIATPSSHGGLIGESPALIETLEHASRAAALSRPVLVIGERGTGKELVAERLHYLSPRWDGPFVKLNCAALTDSLLETELFGHEAGAFTGAQARHIGRFERAEGGTLLLDELATISLRMQEKILRAIEYSEFERVGGDRTLSADVRIVAATNADLPALAARGAFRFDLLDRLAFDVIRVPPLRDRPEDIRELAEHFAIGMTRELGRDFFAGFQPEAMDRLLGHSWPGNVRELKNAVERSIYRHAEWEEPVAEIFLHPFGEPTAPVPDRSLEGPPTAEGEPPDQMAASAGSPGAKTLPTDLDQALAAQERSWLEQALKEARYNQRVAAARLGLGYERFRNRLRKHGLSGRRRTARQQETRG